MGILINQLLDIDNKVSMDYIYVFEFNFKSHTLYTLGSIDDTLELLLDIVKTFYEVSGYIPQASILIQRQVVDSIGISNSIIKELEPYRFKFGKLQFRRSFRFYSINPSEYVDKLVPCKKGLELTTLLPDWAYIDSDYELMAKTSLDKDDNYIVYKV